MRFARRLKAGSGGVRRKTNSWYRWPRILWSCRKTKGQTQAAICSDSQACLAGFPPNEGIGRFHSRWLRLRCRCDDRAVAVAVNYERTHAGHQHERNPNALLIREVPESFRSSISPEWV